MTLGLPADSCRVGTYILTLHYPNGRSHDLIEDGERPLALGQTFERFGRTWKVSQEAVGSSSAPTIFDCHPVSEQRVLSRQEPKQAPELSWAQESPADTTDTVLG